MISCDEIVRFETCLAETDSENREDFFYGYAKDANNVLYQIKTQKKFVPNLNRSSIVCAEFARYFCYEGTVVWRESSYCSFKCSDKVKF